MINFSLSYCNLKNYLFWEVKNIRHWHVLLYSQVASYYARMLDHDYTSKEIFNKNFFEDWRKEMTSEERKVIKDLKKCDFKEMHAHFVKVMYDNV